MGLTEIIENSLSKRPIVNFLVQHPKLSGCFVSCSYLIGGAFEATFEKLFLNNDREVNGAILLGLGFSTYFGLKLFNEYLLKKREIVSVDKNDGLLKKLDHLIFNNPSFFAAMPIIGDYLLWNYGFNGRLENSMERSIFSSVIIYAISHGALNLRRTNELFIKSYRSFKSKNLASRIADFFLEKPLISSGVIGLGSSIYLFSTFKLSIKYAPISGISLATYLSFPLAYTTYTINTLAAGIFHSSSRNLFKNNLKVSWNILKGNYDKAIDNVKDILKISTSPARKAEHHLKLSDLYIRKNELDYSLLHIKQALELLSEEKKVINPFDWLRDLFKISKFSDIIKNISDELSDNPIAKARQSVFYFKKKKFDFAINKIKQARKLAPNEFSYKVLHALELDMIGRNKEAENFWKYIISNILESDIVQFKKISNTSKEVLSIVSDLLLADSIILARDRKIKKLRQEYNYTRFVYDYFPDKKLVPHPLAFLKIGKWNYFVNSRIKGDILTGKKLDFGDISSVLELYYRLVSSLSENKDRIKEYSVDVSGWDYNNILFKKGINRLPCNKKTKNILVKTSYPIIDYCNKRPQSIIHGNFHGRNVMKGKNYCVIDFGDLASAFDTCGIEQFISDRQNSDSERLQIYKDCSQFDPFSRNEKLFLKDCLMGSVFINPWLTGRSYYYGEGNPKVHQQNLLIGLDMLCGDSFINQSEKEQLLEFNKTFASVEFN
ncbi:hypothetical protein KY314_02325 [Candidatus Woesearchaeota archaeon]|nr:hypothetical protein [Candidatus Woesearchaeota archaeon]